MADKYIATVNVRTDGSSKLGNGQKWDVQLLRVVIPRFEALHKEGQSGEAKLTQYTRYLTIGLAVLQSTTILVTARSGALFNYKCDQVIPDGSVWNLVVMVLIMTGGTGLIMWIELQLLEQKKQLTKKQTKLAKDGYLPSLSLTGTLMYSAFTDRSESPSCTSHSKTTQASLGRYGHHEFLR